MKRLLGALAALMLCASAAAQVPNPCGVTPAPTAVTYFDDISGGNGYSCLPSPIGTGAATGWRTSSAGAMVWWYCLAAGKYRPNFFVITRDALNGAALMATATALLRAPDPTSAASAAIAAESTKPASATSTLPLGDPRILAVTCEFSREMYAAKPPDPPAAAVTTYQVTKSATGSTRNAYTPSGGVLGPATGQATVGAACDCSAPVKIGLTSYCTFAGAASASQVTVCTKVTP